VINHARGSDPRPLTLNEASRSTSVQDASSRGSHLAAAGTWRCCCARAVCSRSTLFA